MHLKRSVILPLFAAGQVFGQQEAFRFALTQSADQECLSPEHESSSIWIRLALNYTEACYNIDDLFQSEFGYGPDNQSTCLYHHEDCNHEWEARLPDNYDPVANYSYISWQVSTTPGEMGGFPNHNPADVALRVFDGEDCEETSGNLFYQWGGCEEPANDCVQLPYSVGSFRVMKTAEQNKSDGCLVAAERGAGNREHSVHFVTVAALLVGVVIFVS
ncbi:hypothetical protein Q7P37_000842 [Cladosporium fusiforme]